MDYDGSVDRYAQAVDLVNREQYDEALTCLAPLVAEGARADIQVSALIGMAYGGKRDYRQALHWSLLAHSVDPNRPDVMGNVGFFYSSQGMYDEAIKWTERALKLSPHSPLLHWNYGQLLLICGDYEQGMKEYAWGRCLPKLRPNRTIQPEITKEELSDWAFSVIPSTLHVWGEQGCGDYFFLFRYVQFLRKLLPPTVKIRLECRAQVSPLLSGQSFPPEWGEVEVVNFQSDGGLIPETDMVRRWAHVNLFTLLGYFGPMPQENPIERPIHQSETQVPGKVKIGVCWKGSSTFNGNADRSMAPEVFQPIIERTRQYGDVTFYSLVPMQTLEGATACQLGDYAQTAALVEKLDLVITTCTSMAHLAGAMHKPTFVLLHKTPYWMWGKVGVTSVFYPFVRLFRQEVLRDWSPVVEGVIEATRAFIVERERAMDEPMVDLTSADAMIKAAYNQDAVLESSQSAEVTP